MFTDQRLPTLSVRQERDGAIRLTDGAQFDQRQMQQLLQRRCGLDRLRNAHQTFQSRVRTGRLLDNDTGVTGRNLKVHSFVAF